jgi:protein O-mannosyl-transferase
VENSADQPNNRTKDFSLNEQALLGTVLALTALTFAATMHFDFVYDDQNAIVRNPMVQSWASVPGYFLGKEWPAKLFPNAAANYFRPLNALWYRINYALFGLHPGAWHATTILLHLIATYLCYQIARRLSGSPIVAALAALLFGIHPTRHEVVAWVSGTTELLWSVCFLAGFLAYLESRERDRGRWIAISCACYGLGLLAKETAVVLPLVIFAHAWLYGPRTETDQSGESGSHRLWGAFRLASVYGIVLFAYLALRVTALHGFQHPQTNVSLREFLFTFPSVAFFYVRQWLVPMHLGEFYVTPLWSTFDVVHVLLPLLALMILAAILWFARNALGPRDVAFGVVWMVAPLLPVLDFLVLPSGQLVHDRYLYLPSFGAAFITALALSKLATGAKATSAFGIPARLLVPTLAIVVLCCYATADASSYWMDDYTFSQHSYEMAPTNVVARVNYAIALAGRRDYLPAMRLLDGVLYEEPNNWLANFNLGRVFYNMGLYRAARNRFEQVEKLYPTMPDNYLQLGLVAMKMNNPEEAEANMRRAVELQPDEATFRFSLGIALETEGKCDEARSEFAQTLAIDPAFPNAQDQMTKCGSASGENNPAPSAGESVNGQAPAQASSLNVR